MNHDSVLGSWNSNGFLHGTDGNPGWMPESGLQALLGDLTTLIRDLTTILNSLVGPWSGEGEHSQGMGALGDWRGHGSGSGLDDGSGHHHHHHDMWNPGQH